MPADMFVPTGPTLLFDRSARLRMEFTGAKAAESLTGLVTNDVLALRGGDGLYACALTAKGRIIADVRIQAFTGDGDGVLTLLADTNAAAGVGFAAMIRKYVNPRLAKYQDLTASTACFTLAGGEPLVLLANAGVDAAVLATLADAAPFTHRVAAVAAVAVEVSRVPDLGAVETIDVHCARVDAPVVRDALLAAGAVAADDSEWHRRRVLAGRPEWGVDMDEGTLAQEANMDALHAISYQKGCYTGQETVARVHFRGHVNRTLRRITLVDGLAPVHGTMLTLADGTAAGDTRSTAPNDAGVLIGIAMLRREIGDAAELLWTDSAGGRHAVHVVGAAEST